MIDPAPNSVVIPMDKTGRPKGVYRIDGNGRKKRVYDGKTLRQRARETVEVQIDVGINRKGQPVPVLSLVVADGPHDTRLSDEIGHVKG